MQGTAPQFKSLCTAVQPGRRSSQLADSSFRAWCRHVRSEASAAATTAGSCGTSPRPPSSTAALQRADPALRVPWPSTGCGSHYRTRATQQSPQSMRSVAVAHRHECRCTAGLRVFCISALTVMVRPLAPSRNPRNCFCPVPRTPVTRGGGSGIVVVYSSGQGTKEI